MAYLGSWSGRAGAALVALLALVGCVDQQGFSARDAEWERLRQGDAAPFSIVAADQQRAVVAARGRQVAIQAAEGFCLARDSLEMSDRSAFALIGDCALETPAKGTAGGRLQLAPGVPGIVTVSVSGDGGFVKDGKPDGTLQELDGFLRTAAGREMLGRGGDASTVTIRKSKTIGKALYVLIEDTGVPLVPVLAPEFWRAFVDLNGRFSVITISGFRDRPLGEDRMLDLLVKQVDTLRLANAVPLNERRTYIADASEDGGRDDAGRGPVQALSDLEPEGIEIVVAETRVPERAPVPAARQEDAAAGAEAAEAGDAAETPRTESEPPVADAPEREDPQIRLEIAAVTDSVPVPEPRPGDAVAQGGPADEREAGADVAAADRPAEEAGEDGVADDTEPGGIAANAVPGARGSPADGDRLAIARPAAAPRGRPAADDGAAATPEETPNAAPERAPRAPKRPK